MSDSRAVGEKPDLSLSSAARSEFEALGLDGRDQGGKSVEGLAPVAGRPLIEKRPIEARDVLMEALRDYGGTLLFVSHDRLLINALADKVIEITPGESTARVRHFPGDYDDYVASPEAGEARLGAKSKEDTPTSGEQPRSRKPSRIDRESARALRARRERVSEIESAIETAEARMEQLDWKSADPELARDGERMRELQRTRKEGRQALDQLYSEWERISAELEAAENDPQP